MKIKWKTLRMGAMLFALPIVATAAASAHQFLTVSAPIAEATPAMVSNDGILNAQRSHTVSLNESGSVEGRIATIDSQSQANGLSGLKVFLVSNGEIQAEAVTDADGLFSLANISEGVYSFVATGESGFAAYGVQVLPNNGSDSVNLMEAAAVSPQSAVVKQILKEQLPADVAQHVMDNAVVSEQAAQATGFNKIRTQDGVLVGHVVPMLGEVALAEGTSVFLFQNNEQVAEVVTDASGSFAVQDVEPGVYDFVAAGPTGFAAVSFEAVEQEAAKGIASIVSDSEEIPVSLEPQGSSTRSGGSIPADIPFDGGGFSDGGFVDGGIVDGGFSNSLDVCTTCQQDSGFVGEQVGFAGDQVVYDDSFNSSPIEYAGESCGCGAASGGTCGGVSDFSGFSSCNSCNAASSRGGLFSRLRGGSGGGLFGGAGSGFRRLALLGGIATAIAVSTSDDDNDSSPF